MCLGSFLRSQGRNTIALPSCNLKGLLTGVVEKILYESCMRLQVWSYVSFPLLFQFFEYSRLLALTSQRDLTKPHSKHHQSHTEKLTGNFNED